eukprot:8407911-Alexandrium_andersonii.AAC.1
MWVSGRGHARGPPQEATPQEVPWPSALARSAANFGALDHFMHGPRTRARRHGQRSARELAACTAHAAKGQLCLPGVWV